MNSYTFIATCPEETKEATVFELKKLGATDIVPRYRAVSFCVNEDLFYEAHLRLATVSQIFWELRSCSAKSQEMLFSQAKRVRWHKYFDVRVTYRVDAISRSKDDFHPVAASKKVREAIEDDFWHHLKQKPRVDVKNPDLIVQVYIDNGKASISILTSGKSMHKRGYRLGKHPAPVKETMAASLLHLLEYDGSTPLLDAMCGSGTIATEASFIALGKACMIHRKKGEFAFEALKTHDAHKFREIQDKLRLAKHTELPQPIYANDISHEFVEMSRENALRARTEKHITFTNEDFFQLKSPQDHGLLIANLPYDQRLSQDEMMSFYKAIGDHLKQEFKGWKAALLVATDTPWKHIGLKTSKKYSLLNGSIETKLLVFDIF